MEMSPSARAVLLIRPANFGYNSETAETNEFQNSPGVDDDCLVNQNALAEFDQFAESLNSKGIKIRVFEDSELPAKPDAVFPNNWVSFHGDGTVILYPMCSSNRRGERRMDIIETLRHEFHIEKIIDLSHFEREGRFLEGTGSMVFDHAHKTAYACISPRTDSALFAQVSQTLGYRPITFRAVDANDNPIYHTNVMMCIGPGFSLICLESIKRPNDKAVVIESMKTNGFEMVDISMEQMEHFCGNMLAVSGDDDRTFLVLSTNAMESLNAEQIEALEKYADLLPIAIPTIERVGGGGVRCMMAEVPLWCNV